MAGLSISQAWEETKARIGEDGKLLMTVAAATVLLPQALVAVVGPPELLSGVRPAGWFNLLVFLAAFISLIGQLAIIRLAIGPATSVGEGIAHGARRFLPAFAALLMLGVLMFLITIPIILLMIGVGGIEAAASGAASGAVSLAALIIVILGILIGARFLMIMPVAAAEPGGPIHILKRSWALVKGHYLKLVAFVVLLVIAVLILTLAVQLGAGAIIGILFDIRPFSAGALLYGLIFGGLQAFYAVVISVLLARMYLQLTGPEVETVSVPSSGT